MVVTRSAQSLKVNGSSGFKLRNTKVVKSRDEGAQASNFTFKLNSND
jgi:hypothetical protein